MTMAEARLIAQIHQKAVCLVSGGVDSMVALALMVRAGWGCTALFVDYGQQALDIERNAFEKVCERLRVERSYRKISLWESKGNLLLGDSAGTAMLQHRNLVLLIVADIETKARNADAIVTGFCRSPLYPDSSRPFCQLAQHVIQQSGQSNRIILAPLLDLTKVDIGRLARELSLPLDMTASCYCPSDSVSCQVCEGCKDRVTVMEAWHASST